MRIEAAVEGGEIAVEREEFVELGEDGILREDVAAFLPGKLVEGAVVTLGDADVCVVHDAHDHVGAFVARMEAVTDGGGEFAQRCVVGVLPEPARVVDGDAFGGGHFLANCVEFGCLAHISEFTRCGWWCARAFDL